MKITTVLGLLIGIIGLGGILAYVYTKGPNRSPQAYFESGKNYYDAKKYPEAAIEFMGAISKDPKHRGARYYLALTSIEQHNQSDALKQLQSLLEYYPDDAEANIRLGILYLSGGRSDSSYFRLAQEKAKKLLEKDPKNVDAIVLLGQASAGRKDYTSALDLFEKALAIDPDNSAALVGLGTSKANLNNSPEAEKAFLQARAANPRDKGPLVSLAAYYQVAGDNAKSEAALRDALALDPADKDVYVRLADLYARMGRSEELEKLLRATQTAMPSDPTPSLMLVNYIEARKSSAEARKMLVELKSKFPSNVEILGKLASNEMPDQPDQARADIDQLIRLQPKNPVGYVLLGELQFRSGQFDAAEATLGKDPALNSPYPQAHFFLGNLSKRKGQIDQALDHFQKALAIDRGSYLPARVALAETFMTKGRLADSRVEIDKVLQIQPANTAARLIKATLDIADKKYPEAERELTTLAQQQPANSLIQHQLGVYYSTRGRNAEAEKSFVRALELTPSEQNLRDLVLFYSSTKQADRAMQKLNSIPDAQKQPYHYELIGVVASQAGKLQESENAFQKALDKDPTRSSSQMLLFEQYNRTGRLDDALKVLDDRLRKNPSDGNVYAMRGRVYEKQGRIEEAKQDYLKALKADPANDLASNNLAYIYAEEGHDLTTALDWAQGARKRHSEDPYIADTLGWVYFKTGRMVLAREEALFAVSKQPQNPLFQYHLGMIYKANNQRPEAEAALKKAAGSSTDFKDKSAALAALKDIDRWRHLVQ